MTLRVDEYDRSEKFIRLSVCPFCDHEFGKEENQSQHIFNEHDPSDVPALADSDPESGGGVGAD